MTKEECPSAKKPPDEYRKWLIEAEHKAQDNFDKAVLSLSGGALGVSFIFVKDIIGPSAMHSSTLLLAAWLCWAFSSLSILASFFTSHLALRLSIKQCDDGSIYEKTPGGRYSSWTKYLNAAGAALFFSGICFMAIFVYTNLSARDHSHVNQKTNNPAAQPAVKATVRPNQPDT